MGVSGNSHVAVYDTASGHVGLIHLLVDEESASLWANFWFGLTSFWYFPPRTTKITYITILWMFPHVYNYVHFPISIKMNSWRPFEIVFHSVHIPNTFYFAVPTCSESVIVGDGFLQASRLWRVATELHSYWYFREMKKQSEEEVCVLVNPAIVQPLTRRARKSGKSVNLSAEHRPVVVRLE